jgi:protein tyrosine phosphatase (PTP) superfamily phosphohydrolase (DUF442 family)
MSHRRSFGRSRLHHVLSCVILLGGVAACSGSDDSRANTSSATASTDPTDSTANGSPPRADGAAHTSASRTMAAVKAPDLSPLANLLSVAPGVFSGAMPRGDAGFAGLQALGVRTIISVDAAAPDLERARALGIRYVHVPTRYATITEAEQAAVARAIAEADGPVFVHCHHGKHRGPAAVAAAMRCLDRLSPEDAEAFITRAGTSPNYPGLWAAVREATPRDTATLEALAPVLAERAEPDSFAAAMADADRHWDHLKLLAARGWEPDPDHPDLAPAAEAGILADLFRTMAEQVEARAYGRGFVAELERSAAEAAALERSLDASPRDLLAAGAAFAEIGDACRSCHRVHRDSE